MPNLTAAEVWRDHNLDGVPGSGVREPPKAEVRQWATDVAEAAYNLTIPSLAVAKLREVPLAILEVQTLCYAAPGDGGGARYRRAASEPSHAGKWQDAAGAWWEIAERSLRIQHFGGRTIEAAGNVANSAAILLWFSTWRALRGRGVCAEISGLFYVEVDLLLDFANAAKGGAMVGVDRHHDGFRMADGKRVQMFSSAGDIFYERLADFRIHGKIDGQLLTIGLGDYSDAWNSCNIDLIVNNDFASLAQVGVCLNHVFQSRVAMVINCGGSGNPAYSFGDPANRGFGRALWLRQCAFNNFSIALGSANIGLELSDFSFGNTFDGSLDIEEVWVGIVIHDETCKNNTFLGGTVVAMYLVDAQAGFNNSGAFNPGTYPGGALFKAGGERFKFEKLTAGFDPLTFPAPASNTVTINKTGRSLALRFAVAQGGTFTECVIYTADGNSYALAAIGVTVPVPLVLQPYDAIKIGYTGALNWSVYPGP